MFVKASLASLALLMASALPAVADGRYVPNIWWASSAEVGPVSWTGFIISPDVGYTSFEATEGGGARFNDAEGWYVGGEIGYDYQVGNIVLGVVSTGAFSWLDADAAGGIDLDIDAFGTVRARLGVAFDRFLVFGTGGAAFATVDVTNAGVSEDDVLSGWAAGGGIEYKWNRAITLRFEYLHINLGDESFSNLLAATNDVGLDSDQFNFGLVTRF
ncbi:MAG: outer membrane beta-barrel protein [Pseudomonadota bacterium]